MRFVPALSLLLFVGCSSSTPTPDLRENEAGPIDPGPPPPPTIEPVDSGAEEPTPPQEQFWPRLEKYLSEQFDPTVGLVRDFPGSNRFGNNANVLAAHAFTHLPTPDVAKYDTIISRLERSKICGCELTPGHNALVNHRLDPLVTKGAKIPLEPLSACGGTAVSFELETDTCQSDMFTCQRAVFHVDHSNRKSDACSTQGCKAGAFSDYAEVGLGKGYADLLALQILNHKNRGMDPEPLWKNLVSKWDGIGLNDRSTANDKGYQTYKVALLRIAARVLDKPVPEGVDGRILLAQAENGGIRHNYDLKGAFNKDKVGNTEVTAMVVLALRKPASGY